MWTAVSLICKGDKGVGKWLNLLNERLIFQRLQYITFDFFHSNMSEHRNRDVNGLRGCIYLEVWEIINKQQRGNFCRGGVEIWSKYRFVSECGELWMKVYASGLWPQQVKRRVWAKAGLWERQREHWVCKWVTGDSSGCQWPNPSSNWLKAKGKCVVHITEKYREPRIWKIIWKDSSTPCLRQALRIQIAWD